MDQSPKTEKVLLETPYRKDNLPPAYEEILAAFRIAVGHHGRLASPTAAANIVVSFVSAYDGRPTDALYVVNFLRNEDILVSEEGDALVFFDPQHAEQMAAAEAYLRAEKPKFGKPPCRTFHELIALVGAALTVDKNTAGLVVASLTSKQFLQPDPVDPSLAWVDEKLPTIEGHPAVEPEVARPAPPSPTPAPGSGKTPTRRIVHRFTVRVQAKEPKRSKPATHKPAGPCDDELKRLEEFIADRTGKARIIANLLATTTPLERHLLELLTILQKSMGRLKKQRDRVASELREARRLLGEFKDYARSAR